MTDKKQNNNKKLFFHVFLVGEHNNRSEEFKCRRKMNMQM